MKLETDTYPQEYAQEVVGESQFFDNIRHFAEFENEGPGEEFHYDVDLTAHPSGAVHIEWLGSPLGYLPAKDATEWWPFISRMSELSEDIEVEARIWTSPDWEGNFYASVRLELPTIDEALDEAVRDSLIDFTTRDAMNLPALPARTNMAPPPVAQPASSGPNLGMQSRGAAISEYESGRKQGLIMWLLWAFLGSLGGHRYYLGDTRQGVFMTIAGLCFLIPGLIWALIDALQINKRIREINQQKWANVVHLYKVPEYPMPESAQ